MLSPSRYSVVLLQIGMTLAVMAAIPFWPPSRGALLVIPLSGSTAGTVNVALSANGAILGLGPIAGSVLVAGDRARIEHAATVSHLRIVTLGAPSFLCGDAGRVRTWG